MSNWSVAPHFIAASFLFGSVCCISGQNQPTGFKDVSAAKDFLNRRLTPESMRATKLAIFAPKPEYPKYAREHRWRGTIFVMLHVDKKSGLVMSVEIVQSTGYKILDDEAVTAYRRWRFKPGALTAQ